MCSYSDGMYYELLLVYILFFIFYVDNRGESSESSESKGRRKKGDKQRMCITCEKFFMDLRGLWWGVQGGTQKGANR